MRAAPHPGRLSLLNNLANALRTRFDQLGQREDLDEAISLHRGALELRTAPHPDRPGSLNNLANALRRRFDQLGQREDLDKAISLHRQALELFPAPHPDRPSSLNNLANTLSTRFHQLGKHEDLDEAISLHRQALELFPAPHPNRPGSLNNLANALRTRFPQSGQREDPDEAISLHREVLELRTASHSNRSRPLNDLGLTLQTRFDHSDQREDLDEAISFHREALELRVAPHPDRSNSLSNLANALRTRFNQSDQREDLDKAISLHREALELFPAPHPNRPGSLHNLANALSTRFDQSGQRDDLDKAISTLYEAIDNLVSGHPDVCSVSISLGELLVDAYIYADEFEYLHKVIAAFRMAVMCETASVSKRFRAAKQWAHYADSWHESALDAYQAAIDLLPRLVSLGLNLHSRHQALSSGTDGLARNAAACAIQSGQYDKAIELLEEGRAIFWSQALQLRMPMMDLHDVAPELEEKLRHISLALEQGSLRDASRSLSHTPQKVMSMEREASHFHRLNDEWLVTLEEVRQLDGFQDFLRPSRLSTLQCAAASGPIVVLNASQAGCAALILTSAGVQHVPLPNLNFTLVTKLVKLLRCAIGQDGRDPSVLESNRANSKSLALQMPFISDTLQLLRLPLERHGRPVQDTLMQPDDIFRYVLGMLWEGAIGPVIQSLDLKVSWFRHNFFHPCWTHC